MYLYLCSNTKNDRNVTINVQVVLIGVLMLICFEISTGPTQCYSTLYTPNIVKIVDTKLCYNLALVLEVNLWVKKEFDRDPFENDLTIVG